MNKKSKTFDDGRRLFLKAAGVSIALPALESLAAPARKDAGEPMRMVCISSALGLYPRAFFPKSFGADYELSPTLQPLANMRDHFTVFSHMDHPGIFSKHGAMKSVLSGVSPAGAPAGAATHTNEHAQEEKCET